MTCRVAPCQQQGATKNAGFLIGLCAALFALLMEAENVPEMCLVFYANCAGFEQADLNHAGRTVFAIAKLLLLNSASNVNPRSCFHT